MNDKDESKEFWEEKKQETGKEILYKGFARFIGEASNGRSDISGLMYATSERVYFEDFEKTSMMDMFMKKKRKYEKYTMNFLISDISDMREVSQSSAAACIEGDMDEGKPIGGLMKLFNTPAWEIKFRSANSYFFELFDAKELLSLLNIK